MPPTEIDPIERKASTKVFFVLGSLFFFVSVWAFYNEVVSRRTWKEYQREFNSLELKKVRDEHEKTKQQIETEDARRDQLADPVAEEAQLSLRKVRLKRLILKTACKDLI